MVHKLTKNEKILLEDQFGTATDRVVAKSEGISERRRQGRVFEYSRSPVSSPANVKEAVRRTEASLTYEEEREASMDAAEQGRSRPRLKKLAAGLAVATLAVGGAGYALNSGIKSVGAPNEGALAHKVLEDEHNSQPINFPNITETSHPSSERSHGQ